MASEQPAVPFSIGAFGISHETRQIIDTIFGQLGERRFRLATDGTFAAGILDLDHDDADGRWNEYRSSYPDLPTIIFGAPAARRANAIALTKPVSPRRLLDALNGLLAAAPAARELPAAASPRAPLPPAACAAASTPPLLAGAHAQVSSATTAALDEAVDTVDPCGAADDVDLGDPAVRPKIYYDAARRFQGECETAMAKARESGQAQVFSLALIEHPIWFSPEHGGEVLTALSPRQIRSLCLVPLAESGHAIVAAPTLPKRLDTVRRVAFDRFIWEVALWSSRGRLPEGTPLDRALRLQRWPNFTRIQETPYAMRITAWWTRQPGSIAQAVAALGIPQRHVFSFLSAACAAKLVAWEPVPAAADGATAADPAAAAGRPASPDGRPGKRDEGDWRGFFDRLLTHLTCLS